MVMVKVIGIDPGLAATGVGIVTGRGVSVGSYSCGMIRTEKTLATAVRLESLFARLQSVLEDERPDLMVVEDVYSLSKYPKSGIVLGKVIGVILLAACRSGLPVAEVPVREAKKVLTGSGNASKDQLERAVRHQLKLTGPIRPDHLSDALALALIGLFRYEQTIRGRQAPAG